MSKPSLAEIAIALNHVLDREASYNEMLLLRENRDRILAALRVAESRTVTDAQRKQIENVIRIITTCQRYQSEIAARRVCEILEEQPAAEGAP